MNFITIHAFFVCCVFFVADDIINESLLKLNTDFPMPDSPSNDLPKFDSTPLPAPSGLPKFDDTPLPVPRPDGGDSFTLLGVGASGLPSVDHTPMFPLPSVAAELDSSIAPGEHTAGPLFDVTPLHKVQDVAVDATVSPMPECTPEWQDTPSQSVVGPEEVTQEHNVQEQLDKYAKEHKARVEAHEKKVIAYQRRKHPDRFITQEAIVSDVPQEESCAEPSPSKRTRVAVAKRKNSTAEVCRRSSRVACTVQKPSHDAPAAPVKSQPVKSKSAKRKRVADSSYNLDDEADAEDDDFEDFKAEDDVEVCFLHFYFY